MRNRNHEPFGTVVPNHGPSGGMDWEKKPVGDLQAGRMRGGKAASGLSKTCRQRAGRGMPSRRRNRSSVIAEWPERDDRRSNRRLSRRRFDQDRSSAASLTLGRHGSTSLGPLGRRSQGCDDARRIGCQGRVGGDPSDRDPMPVQRRGVIPTTACPADGGEALPGQPPGEIHAQASGMGHGATSALPQQRFEG